MLTLKSLKKFKEDKHLLEHPQKLVYANGEIIVSRCDALFYAKFRRRFKKKLLCECIFLDLIFILKAVFFIVFLVIPKFIIFLPFGMILGLFGGIILAFQKAMET